jgi:hypothetical protein
LTRFAGYLLERGTGVAPEAVTVALRALERQGWTEHTEAGGGPDEPPAIRR